MPQLEACYPGGVIMKKSIVMTVVAVLSLLLLGIAEAADKKKVVLQITDNSPQKQTLVLNVATNLKKIYGEDKVDVEIVAFGPGLNLLLANNVNTKRIDGLGLQDVKFSACKTTMRKMEKKSGKKPKLHSFAKPVKGGIIRIVELVEDGYILVRP